MQEVFDYANEKMEKTLKSLHNEFASMRAGRATVSLLDKISVDYYGVPTPVNQMAGIKSADGGGFRFRRQNFGHSAVGRQHHFYN